MRTVVDPLGSSSTATADDDCDVRKAGVIDGKRERGEIHFIEL